MQQRGAAIIKARGLSSAASAANAVIGHRPLANDRHRRRRLAQRRALFRRKLRRGERIDLVLSRCASAAANWEIVQDVPINEFSRDKIDTSVAELKEEKSLVGELLVAAVSLTAVGARHERRYSQAFRRSVARTLRRISPPSSRSRRRATSGRAAFCPNRASRDNRARIVCRSWAGFGRRHIDPPARIARNPASALRRSGASSSSDAGRIRISCRRR